MVTDMTLTLGAGVMHVAARMTAAGFWFCLLIAMFRPQAAAAALRYTARAAPRLGRLVSASWTGASRINMKLSPVWGATVASRLRGVTGLLLGVLPGLFFGALLEV